MSSKKTFYGKAFRRNLPNRTPDIYLDEVDLSPAEFLRLEKGNILPGRVVRVIPARGGGDYGKIRVKNTRPLIEV